MSQIELGTSKGQLVALAFGQANVSASQSDVQLVGNQGDGYTMPWAGEIVGISYGLSAAASAGQLTVGPTIDGTEQTDPKLTITTGASGYDLAARGTARFAAGARIGAEITTNSGWNGTTAELDVAVWVIQNIEGI